MKMMKVIKVNVEHLYFVDMIDEEHTVINGWKMEDVIKDWFKNPDFPFERYHATRNGHEIGGSASVKGIEVVEIEDIAKERGLDIIEED